MSDCNTFLGSWEQHCQAVTKANELNKAIVFDALGAAAITTITVSFDGEGDSGQIDDVTAYAGGQTTQLPATPINLRLAQWGRPDLISAERSLHEAVETLCYGDLEQEYSGWENNDGAYGAFEFNVSERTISLSFNARYIAVEETSHSY
jgi:hypothetical protein